MDCGIEEETASYIQNPDVNDSESSENFKKFITELFEKNGILNDLRAYLRGHIVDVLKSAETGAPPVCKKHFTQRLELVYQALNMLIAEYLLRLEFNYSLSVFISEIPLANMVFEFARNIMTTSETHAFKLRFEDSDVWSVLHYLGVKCDSVHASKIMELYKCGKSPLLHCILANTPMVQREQICFEDAVISNESVSSSGKSTESCEGRPAKHSRRPNPSLYRCKHYASCKACQNRVFRIRERYKKRKVNMEKNEKQSSMNPLNVNTLMKNVNVLEKTIIDEMFQQLRAVYEAEVEMIKEEEERRVQRSQANHQLQLQKHRQEMEDTFKAREAELEQNIQKKKKFLWGLARALRDQHEHMTLAMRDVQHETRRLADKESSLKMQLQEAEEILKKRGEDMRGQISQELIILEGHLETMKKERDSINKEKDELENLKNSYESSKVVDVDEKDVDLRSHYDLLKDEIVILKNYIESTKCEPKCFTEKGTVTDLGDGVMNNESVGVRGDDDDDRLKGNQVINDLKKRKNVNFSQSNFEEMYREPSREPSRSIFSPQDIDAKLIRGSDPGCASCRVMANDHAYGRDSDTAATLVTDDLACNSCNRDTILQLREENDRLKTFARQQREHIETLSSERQRLQSRLVTSARPRTAPSVMANDYFSASRVNPSTSANAFGWRKGAGEELNAFSTGVAEPRVMLPGDALPFIGFMRDRHADNRRHLLSQWRALRRRLSPHIQSGFARPRPVAPRERSPHDVTEQPEISRFSLPPHVSMATTQNESTQQNGEKSQRINPTCGVDKTRDKSPKSVLREAKERLKNNSTKEPPLPRDKSPNAVLREAKMRLRKLEIEAEAVEKSYLDFRKRQLELREERQNLVLAESSMIQNVKQLDVKPSKSLQKFDSAVNMTINNNTFNCAKSPDFIKKDFDKYLLEYQTKFDIGQMHFQNKNTVLETLKPIPPSYSKICETNDTKMKNYLETPLTEFRKLYQTSNSAKTPNISPNPISPITQVEKSETSKSESKTESSRKDTRSIRNNQQAELEMLKKNHNKIYNLPETGIPNTNINETDILQSNFSVPNFENKEEKAEDRNVKNNAFKFDNVDRDEIVNSNSFKLEKMENQDVKNNLLQLEVEKVRETNSVGVTESNKDLLLVVESSVDNSEFLCSETDIEEEKIPMTIIVSPKGNKPSPREDKPLKTPGKAFLKRMSKLHESDTLNAIIHANNDGNTELSSIDMQLELTKARSDDEVAKDIQEDYTDDFSADVDNYNIYNSTSDGGNNSPISLPKTSEDENFWNSS